MKIIADTHTHTFVSGDAHSTLLENILASKERGLTFLCITEHVNIFPYAPTPQYFKHMVSIPREHLGVQLIRGVEANIIDFAGTVDMPAEILAWLDIVIASFHDLIIDPGTVAEHTHAWLQVAENPDIDIIGHCGDPRYAFDIDQVVAKFAVHGKVVEINNHSFTARAGSREVCSAIAQACMRYTVPVVVSSDAHFVNNIGNFSDAIAMLTDIDFPHELVLNADVERFQRYIDSKKTQQ